MSDKITSLKDALVRISDLETELRQFKESPLVNTYLSTLTFINATDRSINEESDRMFTVENKPLFEMAHKYQTEKIPYLELLEWIRNKMSPEQQKELNEKIKHETLGIAEKIALNNKNGKQ